MITELVGKILGGVRRVDEHVRIPAVDRVGIVEFCQGQLRSES